MRCTPAVPGPSSCTPFLTLARASLAALALLSACVRELEVPVPPPDAAYLTGRAVAAVPGTDQFQVLEGATVAVLSTNLHAVTDKLGSFTVGPLPAGTYSLYLTGRTPSGALRQRLVDGVRLSRGATRALGDVSLQQNAQLGGRVLIKGLPTGNAGITVFVPGTDFVAVTADSGAWLLRELPEGTVRASAFRAGFLPATTTDVAVQGGIVTSAVDLVLEPQPPQPQPGAIAGVVLVLGAADSAGASVKAVSLTTLQVAASAETGATGAFLLGSLQPDLYELRAERTGLPPARVPNLAVGSGVSVQLASPIILSPLGEANVPSDGGIGPGLPDAGTPDAGTDGGTDGGADGGTGAPQCLSDNQCASGRLCVDGRCVGCSSDVQCRAGWSCRAGDCLPDCHANADCPSGQVCLAGSCGACQTSAQCGDPALVCDSSGACARCQNNAQCPSGKSCLPTGCGDCSKDAECGAGFLCEQKTCVPGVCRDSTACPSGQACVNRKCGACTADQQCRAGQLCLAGACRLADCRDVTECAPGQVCAANLCGACANDADCGAGQLCLQGAGGLLCSRASCRVSPDCTGASAGLVCNTANQCVSCASSAQCGAGQVCTAAGRCAAGDCVLASDCTGARQGWVCAQNHCTPCTADAECGAGAVCDAGACRPGNCGQATPCALRGQLCIANVCSPCSTNAQCGPGQVCGAADHLCHPGQCSTSADCALSAPGKVCDLGAASATQYACVGCTAGHTGDVQCAAFAGEICVSAPAAATGLCAAGNCHGNADCTGGLACLGNACGRCRADQDCSAGQLCLPGAGGAVCAPANCRQGSDCTGAQAGMACLANQCAACTRNADCGAGAVCGADARCHAGECSATADCTTILPGSLCDTAPASPTAWTCTGCSLASGTAAGDAQCAALPGTLCLGSAPSGLCAAANCRANADCAAGSACIGNLCGTCAVDGQCGAGQLCLLNPQSGLKQCAAGECRTGGDCTGGKAGMACLANQCAACAKNADCGAGAVCGADARCHAGQCSATTDCASIAAGTVCDLASASGTQYACVGCSLQTSGSAVLGDAQCLPLTGTICLASGGGGGLCTPGNCRANADCAAGAACVNHACTACRVDGDCGAGQLCLPNGAGGANLCVAADCRTNADCKGAQAGMACSAANRCVACAQTSDCKDATKVCDPGTSRCVTGNCGSNADCAALGFAGQVCVGNTCSGCTGDGQCAAGQLCIASRCKAATCKDNSWCAGGAQICELTTTSTSTPQYNCRPCGPLLTKNPADCASFGANSVCDGAGLCHSGTCAKNADCPTGQVCGASWTCTLCTGDAQCGPGQMCISSECVIGDCRTTADCVPSSRGACIFTAKSGSTQATSKCNNGCQTNLDCGGSGSWGYCNPTSHTCTTCTQTNNQCLAGTVCQGGVCVTGTCTTTNDPGCAPGQACQGNACVQVGPVSSATSSTPVEGGGVALSGSWPMLASGKSRVYLTAQETISGQVQVVTSAFNAGLTQRVWGPKQEGVGSPISSNTRGGLVVPAPGFPDDELYVTLSGYSSGGAAGNTLVARTADDGRIAWSLPGVSPNNGLIAAGVVGGVPIIAWLVGYDTIAWVRTDGTHGGSINAAAPAGCGGNVYSMAMGTKYVYALCTLTVGPIAVDPNANGGFGAVVSWVTQTFSLSNATRYPMVWRAPGDTADTLVISTGYSMVVDVFPDAGAPYQAAYATSPSYASYEPMIDASGTAWVIENYSGTHLKGYTLPGLAMKSHVLLVSSGTTPVTGPTNLAADGTFVMASGGKLYGFGPIPNTVNSDYVPPRWVYDPGSGNPILATMPNFGPTGAILALQNSPSGYTAPVALSDPHGVWLTPSTQAWGPLGGPDNRLCVAPVQPAGGGCTSDASCAATQRCVLGQCIGNCRTAAQCAAGDGCSAASCGPCVGDASCRAGEKCNAGACTACPGGNCCATNLDCAAGQVCVQAQCRVQPAWQAPTTWLNTSSTVGLWNSGNGGYPAPSVLATDGTVYAISGATGYSQILGYRPNGANVFTSATTTLMAYNTPLMLVQDVAVSSTGGGLVNSDVIFTWSGPQLWAMALSASSSAQGQWVKTSLSGTGAPNNAPANLAQGVSKALDNTAPLPTLFVNTSGVQDDKVWAMDASLAARGTAKYLWSQQTFPYYDSQTATTWHCNGLAVNGMLVGSDGTVYQLCREGIVQALAPDGATPGSQPALGVMKWLSLPSGAWPSYGARPAIAAVPGGPDVIYFGRPGSAPRQLTLLSPTSTAPFYTRTTVPVAADLAIAADARGNAFTFGIGVNNYYELASVSPAGALLYRAATNYNFGGFGYGSSWALTKDGLLWFVDNTGSTPWLTALQLSNPALPTTSFLLHGWGNAPFDPYSWLTFVPQELAPEVGAPVFVTDFSTTGFGGVRRMQGMVAPGVQGVSQWGTVCGDAQHRCSLKVK